MPIRPFTKELLRTTNESASTGTDVTPGGGIDDAMDPGHHWIIISPAGLAGFATAPSSQYDGSGAGEVATAEDPSTGRGEGLTVLGCNVPTLTGAGGATPRNDATGHYIVYESAAASGNTAGLGSTGNDDVQRRYGPSGYITMQIVESNNVRHWHGFFSASPMGANTATLLHAAGFRYSTGVPDTNWQTVTNDGGATATVTDTGVAVAADTRYKLGIDARDQANVKFYINGTLVSTHTTDLPTDSTSLGIYSRVATLTAGARRTAFARAMFSMVL